MGDAVQSVIVAGGGTMGAGIAGIFCAGGWRVQVIEPAEAMAATVPGRVAACLKQLSAPPNKPVVVGSLDACAWQDVAVVVECLPEGLSIKQQFFAEAEALAPAETILASNSSSFPISAIAEGRPTRHRMAGLHFFMPAHLVPLVEVISGEGTAPEVTEALMATMRVLDKHPVHVRKDIPGFLANRIQHAMMREALSLVERGIASPEDVDAAVRLGFGMRFVGAGPLLQKDLAGLDIHHAAATTIYPDLCNDPAPAAVLAERVETGDLGVKTGRGFFDWTEVQITEVRTRYEAALGQALAIVKER